MHPWSHALVDSERRLGEPSDWIIRRDEFIGATNDDGSPLLVTERLDTDLRKVLSQRSLHHEEIVCLALDVATALNYLHLKKPFPIIHRDISSSNVLLWRRDEKWRAKLSDYGAASFMCQCMTSYPGAEIYAAPEAKTSQQSPKADVYSFGVLLCEMCIRELPDPQQIQEQIDLVTNGVLQELVTRCVMRAPDARPTMIDVITELTQQAEVLDGTELVVSLKFGRVAFILHFLGKGHTTAHAINELITQAGVRM
ncbi:uncharacterized protein [Acropora muricata]|uniref:uncharacterized protein isoform X2 n=1 Tax=Acropora muricata TaxID=159855 RepID=UPI0034E3794C